MADAATLCSECCTGVAAAKLLLPGWLATTVQVPTAFPARIEPDVEQTLGVSEENSIGSPEDEDAERLSELLTAKNEPGELKVIV